MNRSILVVLACGLLGAGLDFALNGVFKIVWAVIYVPVYLAVAAGLYSNLTRDAAFSFLCGAAIIHLIFTTGTDTRIYSMKVNSTSPLQLGSEAWPQKLFLDSPTLQKKLSSRQTDEPVSVVINRTTNYGCTQSTYIKTIDGFDIRKDPETSWTWRTEKYAPAPTDGPGTEDYKWFWCRFQFYQGW